VGLRAKPFSGGTIRNHFKEWSRNQKLIKSFVRALSFKCFHNDIYIFHIYPLDALILEIDFGITNEFLKILFLIMMASLRITFLNFGNS